MIRLIMSLALVFSVQAVHAGTQSKNLNDISSSLTVYVYPPYAPIDWSTPKSTIKTMIDQELEALVLDDQVIEFVSDFGEAGAMSSVYHSTMGHTISHVNCTLPDGQQYERWTSFTGQNFSTVDVTNLLQKKIGAGVLFYDYVDGEVIAGQENYDHLVFYHGGRNSTGHNRPRYLQFEIDPQGCEQVKTMVTFFESFHHPKMTLSEIEKLPQEKRLFFSATLDPYAGYIARQTDPKAKVGGGCAPYGVALMKMAGRYQDSLETFFRRVFQVSEHLIGGEIDPSTGKMREVSLLDMMFGDLGDHWTYDGYTNRPVNMYDPQLIWNFVGNLMQCVQNADRCDPSVATWMQSQEGVTRGTQEVLTVNYMAPVGPKIGQDGKPTERVPASRSQAIDGMIWRLPADRIAEEK